MLAPRMDRHAPGRGNSSGAEPKRGRPRFGRERPRLPVAGQQQLLSTSANAAEGRASTLEGEVVRVTYENPETGFRVLRVAVPGRREPETLVGVFPSAPPGSHVRATGKHTH